MNLKLLLLKQVRYSPTTALQKTVKSTNHVKSEIEPGLLLLTPLAINYGR